VVTAGEVLVHDDAVEPQPPVQLGRQDVRDAALIVRRSERGQEVAREPERGDRYVAHHRAKATTPRKMRPSGPPPAGHRSPEDYRISGIGAHNSLSISSKFQRRLRSLAGWAEHASRDGPDPHGKPRTTSV
jgi:hypothetical protein